jgi:hypothetical protein
MASGRTCPALLTIIDSNGVEVEVIAKMSVGCDLKEGALVAELLAYHLANDLQLPIPRAYIVEMSPEFVAAIPDPDVRTQAGQSCALCFGSKRLPHGTHAWVDGSPVPDRMVGVAADIFAFDAMIDNVDRRPENTNLLTTGNDIWIYDHELTFPAVLLGIRPPWEVGSRNWLKDQHVLFGAITGRNLDHLGTFAQRWNNVSDTRTAQYVDSIPPEWSNDFGIAVRDRAIQRARDVRDHIGACMDEVRRVLQ